MKRTLLISVALLIISIQLKSQILTFEFSALAGNEASAASNSNNINISSSTLSRGVGLTATTNGGRFNAESWALTSIANAVSGNDYLEFTITPNAGYQFSVSSIVIQWQRSSTGNTEIALRSSADSYATDLDAVKSVADITTTQTFTWTFAQANSASAVTYRLYSYAESTGGSGGPGDGSGNDIVVNGAVSSTSLDPQITLNPVELNDFMYFTGEGPSAEQTFTVLGSNLTNNISIASSANYEISKTSGSGYSSPLTFTPAETATPQTVYVRMKSGLAAGAYLGELITATSVGATNKSVTINGNVKALYTWNNISGGSWTTASNWSPVRTTPGDTDKLVFSDGNIYTITDLPTETIEGLNIGNNTKVTLNSSGFSSTLSIMNGSQGNDLTVSSGSELNISQTTTSNPIILSLGSEATGSISGSMNFSSTISSTPNRLTGTNPASITFNSGAVFTQNTNSSGNVFGTGTTGSIVFSNGSTFIQADGSNPFGTTSGVVTFSNGSLFKLISNANTSFTGKTYANFEMAYPGTITATGTSALTINNLTITQGTFNFNMTGTPGHSIKGNITVVTGATLTFTPTSVGTVNLNGTGLQTISGGGTITTGANSTLAINNTVGVVLDNNAALAGNLSIATSTLTINPSRQLTVTGTLTNSGGNSGLVIKSDVTGTGSLIHNTADVAATVERHIAGSNTTNQYHLVSVPLTAANNPQAGLFLGSYLYYFNQPNQSFVSPGTSVTSPIDVQRGYMIHYPNTATTYEFAGTINAGDFTANTSHHSYTIGSETFTGFNLVPNPYPSAIDWDALTGWTKTNINDAIWIWNPESGNYAAYGDDAGTNGATNYIPAGQAFFVQSSASSPVLTMTNATRVHNSQAFLKDAPVIKDVLRLNAASNGFSDELIVRFLEQSIVANGQKDVAKMTGNASAPQLYSISSENEKLSINNLPFSAETVIIPIGFELDATKDVTFSFSSIESFEPSVNIFLEDTFTGQMVNLRENPVYTFNHTQGNEPQRFKLHLMGVTAVCETPSELAGQIWSDGQSLYLSFPELQSQNALYELFDLNGRLLESRELSLETIQRLQPQASGIVIARVSLSNQVYVNKLFIH